MSGCEEGGDSIEDLKLAVVEDEFGEFGASRDIVEP